MANNHREKQLDRLLDSLLSQYSAVEPRPGLETRVLAQIAESARTENVGSQSRRWWWTAGVASAAALALVIAALWLSPGATPDSRKARPAAATGPAAHTTVAAVRRDSTDRPNRVRQDSRRSFPPKRTSVAEVRQGVFPAPSPLTSQEKLLLRYLAGTPHQEVVAQSHPDDLLDQLASTDDSGVFGDDDMNSSFRNDQ